MGFGQLWKSYWLKELFRDVSPKPIYNVREIILILLSLSSYFIVFPSLFLTTTKVLLLRHIRVAAKREIPISIGGAVQHAGGQL